MKRTRFFVAVCFVILGASVTFGQEALQQNAKLHTPAPAERELQEFFDAYAEDLRAGRGEAIAARYDLRGYYRMGSGGKTLVSFEDNRKRFVTNFAAQKAFAWKDLSIEILAPDVAIVTALFDWQHGTAEPRRYSYSGVLTKRSGQWRIRLEDESPAPLPAARPTPQ